MPYQASKFIKGNTGADTDIQWHLDPLGHYLVQDSSGEEIDLVIEMHGLLPSFVEAGQGESLKKQMEQNYGFGELYEMEGGDVDKGVYKYPGDPDLYPYGAFTRNVTIDGLEIKELVLIYRSGIVAFLTRAKVGDDFGVINKFVTRMD